ncbi:MAG TPA: peptidylprolyl isomerase [Gemmatimonas aurantiaca]|uniref:peptidylprolyl isomerase n=2 Tax=Gemmatimonas aurantiaca TaxID=173480 RepID=C1A720_GEMAT|nr:peptidylprolyl isomerase [Gemmatimonas aurantiaca]BAH38030.1 peptidyl-prolyl cis-trans isomerase [Gemmatimonas aurantiaca T-27]HCT56804.1 peptidylprolyl isomerase [Gemmatimonas aurantiaca]
MITSLLRRVRPAACALLFGSVFGIAAHPATAHAQQPTPGTVAVRIETSLGTILAEIDSARAPISARNFLRYVDSSAYTGGRFHRTVTMDNQPRDTVRIEVIQGGANPAPTRTRFPAIPLERTNATGLKHRNGTLSMARGGPDSATSDFFICIGDQPSLDFGGHRNLDGQGFAAFGQVTQGMDIVRSIQKRPADGQSLKPPIEIVRIERVRR